MTQFLPRRRPASAHWFRQAIAGTLIAVAALLAAIDGHAGPVKTAKNAGVVCFERGTPPGGQTIDGTRVTFRPHLGCLSSSCTKVLESRFEIRASGGVIAMTSRFSVTPREGMQACTADCGGGGRALREIGTLEDGIHSVRLGRVEIGQLDTAQLDAKAHTRICFSTPKPDDPRRKPKSK